MWGNPRDCCSKIDIIVLKHRTHAPTSAFNRNTEGTSRPSESLSWSVSLGRHYRIGERLEKGHARLKARLRRWRRRRDALKEKWLMGRGDGFFCCQRDESVSAVFEKVDEG